MELILDIIFEVILDGTLEVAQSRKVPIVVRIVAAIALLVIYGGLIFLGIALVVHGYGKQDWKSMIVGAVIVIVFVVFLFGVWKKYKR